MKKIAPILLFLLLLPRWGFAELTQFYLEDKLDDQSSVRVYLTADTASQPQVQEALYQAVDHAREIYKKMDLNNPHSELGDLNNKRKKGEYLISHELARAIAAGVEVSKKTHGVFDLTDTAAGGYKQIQVSKRKGDINLKSDNIQINLDRIKEGVVADIIVEDLVNGGWKNCLVKIGSVFASRGDDAMGPWKIPVLSPTSMLAARILFYKARGEVGAATYPFMSHKVQGFSSSDLKSATVFAENGALAQGLSSALYAMGLNDAKRFLKRNGKYRGVLGHQDGQYTHIPSFEKEAIDEKPLKSSPPPLEKKLTKRRAKIQSLPEIKYERETRHSSGKTL